MSKKHEVKTKRKKSTIILISIVVAFVAVLLFDLSPFGGNIRFYGKWHKCGREPVVVGGDYYYTETTPYYKYYTPPIFAPTRPYYRTYCTALEAEQHGFSASREKYEAPELQKRYGDNYCLTVTSPQSETAVRFPYCGTDGSMIYTP